MPYRKVWIEPGTGCRYGRIPPKWRGVNSMTQALAIRRGWRAEVVSDVPDICTKYQFIAAMKQASAELWQKLYQAYQSNLEFSFYWNSVNQLDRNDDTFQALAAKLGATQEDINLVFETAAGILQEPEEVAADQETTTNTTEA